MLKKTIVSVVLLALLLAACGPEATPTPEPTAVPVTEVPATEAPPTEEPATATPVPPTATPEPAVFTAPTGDVILTVTGDLASPNVDDTCQFDAALFDQYAIEQTLDDPWMGDGLTYRGLTLDTIWELCGASPDEAATLVASDGFAGEIAAADLMEWPIMLAYQVDGVDLMEETGGPVKLVYPAEARDTYSDDQWMWWVVEVVVGEVPEAEALSAPTGDVILTVSGDLAAPNVDDTCQFDADLFDQYATEQTLDDPWMGDGLAYRGLTLATIVELCGGSADAETISLVASDGFAGEIATADLMEWPIMLAYQVDGIDLMEETGGPVKLVYPAEARETYSDDQWMWWVEQMVIGEAAVEALPAPTGDVILTVSGDLAAPNVDDTCQFDADLFDQYATEQTLDDPWMGDGLAYRGLTLATIVELCGGSADAETISLVASDGFAGEIATADLMEWPIMLAYQVDGIDLMEETGGPVKLVYPAEARETYSDDQWMWWVEQMVIGEAAVEALPAPTGDVILTVTGLLAAPNVDDTCQFDADLFDQYATEQTLDDPWMGDGLTYRGLTLATIVELCGGSADVERATLIANDGFVGEIATEDLMEWPIMLAYQVDGVDLMEETGGPVKLVYPAEARETYSDDQWMWWVELMTIGDVPAAGALPAPTGDVILTVSGDLAAPNVDDTCQFDADLFDQYATEQTLDDPWMGDGLVYRGLTLDTIMELCGGSADVETISLVASDGFANDIAAADLMEWPIMLAYQVDGIDLMEETGGPVKLVYPAEARETYSDDQWMWWVEQMVIGAE